MKNNNGIDDNSNKQHIHKLVVLFTLALDIKHSLIYTYPK